MISNRCSFDHRVSADMNMVTDFHRVVVESTAKGLVRRPFVIRKMVEELGRTEPHDRPFTKQTISTKLYHNSMSRSRSSEVATDYSTTGNDGLTAQDDVLRTCDGSSARDFVSSVLKCHKRQDE